VATSEDLGYGDVSWLMQLPAKLRLKPTIRMEILLTPRRTHEEREDKAFMGQLNQRSTTELHKIGTRLIPS